MTENDELNDACINESFEAKLPPLSHLFGSSEKTAQSSVQNDKDACVDLNNLNSLNGHKSPDLVSLTPLVTLKKKRKIKQIDLLNSLSRVSEVLNEYTPLKN